MKRQLRGRRVLVTGASRGIGRCLAERLSQHGARLILAARSHDELEKMAAAMRSHGADAMSVTCDITSDQHRERLFATIQRHFGGLDVLINNAGVSSWGHFATSSEQVLRQVMEVNFFAPAELIRQAIPLLTLGEDPAIVNVASICGRRGLPAWSEHSASKFALCGLTEALRGEMQRFGIEVLLVLPGLVRTDDLGRHLLRNEGRMKIDYSKATAPESVAEAVVHALRSRRIESAVGFDARWIERVNRFFPRLVDWLLARKVRQLYADEMSTPAATATERRGQRVEASANYQAKL